ncbi:mitochondrial glutamate carrier 1-like [Teleopsis dalmanni]|uniref:mitochondrial glutamate carrier 1-like n=1 Tax=Teleopsis dalmanni TaxID=139649 RepID=UPI0018CFD044|nr:mitochondrial glutamate carrier 1-like [Teleopsis dalmanni]
MTLLTAIFQFFGFRKEALPQPRKFYLLPSIIDGGIAGIVGLTATYPLDLLVTRLQSQQVHPDGTKMYNGMIDCIYKTYKSEKLLGLYRGYLVSVMFTAWEKAIFLTSNDFFCDWFIKKNIFHDLTFTNQVVSGAIAGASQVVVTNPMELIKIKMQNLDAAKASFDKKGKVLKPWTTWQITKRVVQHNGIWGFYQGSHLTILREVIFSVVYFPLFETLNDLCPRKGPRSDDAESWCSFVAGVAAGSAGAFVATPVDLIKTRLQAADQASKIKKYTGSLDCIRKTYRLEGILAFFKGGLCRVILIAPLFGIAQMVYFFGIGDYLVMKFNLPKF